MNSADHFPLAHDGRREKNPTTPSALIARGEQARRVVAQLVEKLARLEEACREAMHAQPAGAGAGASSADTDLLGRLEKWREQQRRHELEQEDLLRELQRELGALSQVVKASTEAQSQARKPAAASSHAPAPSAPAPGGNSSWELAKKKMLAELDGESEGDESSHAGSAGSGELLAQKDAEIAALRKLVEEQQHFAATVELDAMVQEERQKLRRLQTEWEEKLRRSEVEISIERAKLARERTQLEEKMRRIAPLAEQSEEPANGDKPTEKAARGRWLARLGLLDEQQEG